LDSSRRLHRLP